jgi:hypothetical protein
VFRCGDGCLFADCRLIGRRQLANQTEPQVTTHFTARVRLTPHAAEPVTGSAPALGIGSPIEAADIYRVYFHGPAYQVLKRAWSEADRIVGEMPAVLPEDCRPGAQALAVSPRLIELCFQTAGLLGISTQHSMGLPRHVDRVTFPQQPPANGPVYATVIYDPARECFDAQVVNGAGHRYVQVSGYRTVEFRTDVGPELLRPLETAAV